MRSGVRSPTAPPIRSIASECVEIAPAGSGPPSGVPGSFSRGVTSFAGPTDSARFNASSSGIAATSDATSPSSSSSSERAVSGNERCLQVLLNRPGSAGRAATRGRVPVTASLKARATACCASICAAATCSAITCSIRLPNSEVVFVMHDQIARHRTAAQTHP